MNKKILIVDDQYGIRVLLCEIFRKEGIETYQAENGKEALEIVQKFEPDLVMLDMKIPGMDGLEILRRLRKIDTKIKVMIMTAYGELDMIQEAMSLGATTHFAKPFDIEEIKVVIKKELGIT